MYVSKKFIKSTQFNLKTEDDTLINKNMKDNHQKL